MFIFSGHHGHLICGYKFHRGGRQTRSQFFYLILGQTTCTFGINLVFLCGIKALQMLGTIFEIIKCNEPCMMYLPYINQYQLPDSVDRSFYIQYCLELIPIAPSRFHQG